MVHIVTIETARMVYGYNMGYIWPWLQCMYGPGEKQGNKPEITDWNINE